MSESRPEGPHAAQLGQDEAEARGVDVAHVGHVHEEAAAPARDESVDPPAHGGHGRDVEVSLDGDERYVDTAGHAVLIPAASVP